MSGEQISTFPGFEFLSSLRHHFAGRVHKSTPSGRQQSAVLVILPECLCLCSNRGGFNTTIDLDKIVGITVFPRGKFVILSRGRHDLLLTSTQVSRIVGVVQHLVLGLTGRPLAVYSDDAPHLEHLRLRPDANYNALVPFGIAKSIREAQIGSVRAAVQSAQGALVDPLGQSSDVQQEVLQRDKQKFSRNKLVASAANPSRFVDAAQGSALSSNGIVSPSPLQAAPSSNTSANTPVYPQQPSSPSGAPAPGGTTLNISSPQRLKEASDTAKALTILVINAGQSTITIPAPMSLWTYLNASSVMLPGGRQHPTAKVLCVEEPSRPIQLAMELLFQTLVQFSVEVPHIVTLQKIASGEGHHFDGNVFWNSLNF